jgi:ABC-type transport system involved in multi-copper enzyme maturation permease subunit
MKNTIKNIFTIAINTFRESIRDKIFYAVGFFAVIFAVILFYISTASLGEETHVLRSLGLGGIYIFGIILTLILSSSLLSKEFEKKTVYFIFSRPVASVEIVVGKFFGLFLTIAAATALFSTVYLAMVYFGASVFDKSALLAIFLQLLEMAIFIALIIFFSSFTRPSLSLVATITILYLGHSSTLLLQTAEKSGSGILQKFFRGFFSVFPNLEKFNIRDSIIYSLSLSSAEIFFTILYAVCLIIIFLGLAAIFLKKREL